MRKQTLKPLAAMFIVFLLTSCSLAESGRDQVTIKPAYADMDLPAATLRMTSETFTCHMGDVTLSVDGRYSVLLSVQRGEESMDIMTVNGATYARLTGEPVSSSSISRVKLFKRLDGRWATSGALDSVLIDTLPRSPSGCLKWMGVRVKGRVLSDGVSGIPGSGDTVIRTLANGGSLSQINVESPPGITTAVITTRASTYGRAEDGLLITDQEYLVMVGE